MTEPFDPQSEALRLARLLRQAKKLALSDEVFDALRSGLFEKLGLEEGKLSDTEELSGCVEPLAPEKANEAGEEAIEGQPWQIRLDILAEFLHKVAGDGQRRAGAVPSSAQLPAWLEPFEGLFSQLPAEEAAWARASQMLADHSECSRQFPKLFSPVYQNALVLHPPILDRALWRPFRGSSQPYLAGVALLHGFLSMWGEESEGVLWQARNLVLKGSQCEPMAHPWGALQKWMLSEIEKADFLSPQKKKALYAQVQICCDDAVLTVKDVEDYLQAQAHPSATVLERLRFFVQEKGAQECELQVLLKSSIRSHLTNAELGRLWTLAVARGHHDLAWRLASIQLSRGKGDENLKQAWEISGENRKAYPWLTPTASDFDCCLLDFAPEESRLVWACLKLGIALPLLLSEQDKNITVLRVKDPEEDSLEARVEKALAGIKWFGELKKDYCIAQRTGIPAFAEILPTNEWSQLVAKICHRMGMAAWKWRLSRLQAGIEALGPKSRNQWQIFQKDQNASSKWLSTLSSEQRSAWHDLVQIVQKIDDEKGFRVLACFACRLTTVVYGHHFQALVSLREMRAPVFLIWDLENWLLSEEYSRLRRIRGTENRVMVPDFLRLRDLSGPDEPSARALLREPEC